MGKQSVTSSQAEVKVSGKHAQEKRNGQGQRLRREVMVSFSCGKQGPNKAMFCRLKRGSNPSL